ncbi:MAG: hypothetical protein AAF939_13775, partial [Planctomycetota bacterium]
MSYLIFQIKRLFQLPFDLFLSPDQGLGAISKDSERGKAMLLGLPAIILAILGLILLMIANFGISDSLEGTYLAREEISAKNKVDLIRELEQEARMKEPIQSSGTASLNTAQLTASHIDKDDPRIEQLSAEREKQQIYLEKLIDLNTEQPDYHYRLAMLALETGDRARCLALLNLIAPLDEPGYIKAHMELANYHIRLPAKNRADAIKNVDVAIAHTNQCLKRDQDHLASKKLKAKLLMAKQDFVEAYDLFLELFEINPLYFQKLYEINNRIGRKSENPEVLDRAIVRLQQSLGNDELDERQ